MGKIIIHTDGVSDNDAIAFVSEVVSRGRISNLQQSYCLGTIFSEGVSVFVNRHKSGTDVFHVSLFPHTTD